jgi:hypothetical protein
MSISYSSKLITLLLGALEPVASQRASIKDLMSIITSDSVEKVPSVPKFEDAYTIIKDISKISLPPKEINAIEDMAENIPNCYEISVYLSENKETSKKVVSYFTYFYNLEDASQYCNDKWKQLNFLNHKNLLPIHNIFLQRIDSKQLGVIVIKVSKFQINDMVFNL